MGSFLGLNRLTKWVNQVIIKYMNSDFIGGTDEKENITDIGNFVCGNIYF